MGKKERRTKMKEGRKEGHGGKEQERQEQEETRGRTVKKNRRTSEKRLDRWMRRKVKRKDNGEVGESRKVTKNWRNWIMETDPRIDLDNLTDSSFNSYLANSLDCI